MKKRWIWILICWPLLGLAACSDDDGGGETPPPGEETPPEALVGSETRKLMRVLQAMDPQTALDRGPLVITDEQYAEIKAFTDELCGGKTGEDAYRAINQWMKTEVDYTDSYYSQNPYDVFKNRLAVCQGFSNLQRTMCLTQGIPCVGVNGYLYPGTQNLGHAWNYVYAGDRWLVSDCMNGLEWEMDDVADYSNMLEPLSMDGPVAEDDDFVYGYDRGLNIMEIKADRDTARVPDAVLGYYVTSCNPSAIAPAVRVVVLTSRVDWLGDRGTDTSNGSEGLEGGSFAGKNLEAILVEEGNKTLESYEGVLYYKDSDFPGIVPAAMKVVRLKAAPFGKDGQALYYHDAVEELWFAEGTVSIGSYAVEGCPRLTVVHVPASCADIAPDAFPSGVTVDRY